MASDLSDQVGKLRDQAQAGIDAAAAQAKEMAKKGADAIQETGAAAWEVAQQARAQAREAAGQLYEQGERGAREITARIEERPWAALLVAAALGYAIAYLVHARASR
jgi:ElaB/YqjD/DUF883 family membrane-anchored ribosome-binding protein